MQAAESFPQAYLRSRRRILLPVCLPTDIKATLLELLKYILYSMYTIPMICENVGRCLTLEKFARDRSRQRPTIRQIAG